MGLAKLLIATIAAAIIAWACWGVITAKDIFIGAIIMLAAFILRQEEKQ